LKVKKISHNIELAAMKSCSLMLLIQVIWSGLLSVSLLVQRSMWI